MYQHLPHRGGKIKPHAKSGAKRCFQQVNVRHARRKDCVLQGVGLRLRQVTGDGNHHAGAKRRPADGTAEENAQHRSKEPVCPYHVVKRKLHQLDMIGGGFLLFKRGVSGFQHFIGIHIHGNDRRLFQKNPFVHGADGGLRCPDVKTDPFTQHPAPPFFFQ